MTPQEHFAGSLTGLLPSPLPEQIGVAVSGGGDSTALMHLAAGWARAAGISLDIATIDHGLRAEAAIEAAGVARAAADLNLPHDTLDWRGWDGCGNLQDQARRARYRLLTGWARRRGLGAVLLGHTRDDNVECLVMGLARGAGLDGLSGMRPAFHREGLLFLRPLLAVSRAELREWLRERSLGWIDDPSNDDDRFARVRVRGALAHLATLGVTPDALARSAENLRRSRAGLQEVLRGIVDTACRTEGGDVIVASDVFASLPEEIARRLLNAALRWVSGTDYPPRAENVAHLLRDAESRRAGATLHGCLVRETAGGLRIGREPEAAARAAPATPGTLWDGRWLVTGPFRPGMTIKCLGEREIAGRGDWRAAGLPRTTCLSGPAVWDGGTLVAVPLLEPHCAYLAKPVTDFITSL